MFANNILTLGVPALYTRRKSAWKSWKIRSMLGVHVGMPDILVHTLNPKFLSVCPQFKHLNPLRPSYDEPLFPLNTKIETLALVSEI